MRLLSRPRTAFAAALLAAVLGVVGESIDASVIVHVLSVLCVVVGLVFVVLSVPGLGGLDDPGDHTPRRPHGGPADPTAPPPRRPTPRSTVHRPPRV